MRKDLVSVLKKNVFVLVVEQKSVNVEISVSVKVNVLTVDELIEKSFFLSLSYDERLFLLEEAHLLSQPFAFPHFKVHWEMFKLSWEFKNWKEFWGQIPRMILALPGSWLGKAPVGNRGSTKMGIFEKGVVQNLDSSP